MVSDAVKTVVMFKERHVISAQYLTNTQRLALPECHSQHQRHLYTCHNLLCRSYKPVQIALANVQIEYITPRYLSNKTKQSHQNHERKSIFQFF